MGEPKTFTEDDLKQAENNGFAHAVAWAVQVLITHFGNEDTALELMSESGLTIADLEAAGADEYDLEPIRFSLAQESAS